MGLLRGMHAVPEEIGIGVRHARRTTGAIRHIGEGVRGIGAVFHLVKQGQHVERIDGHIGVFKPEVLDGRRPLRLERLHCMAKSRYGGGRVGVVVVQPPRIKTTHLAYMRNGVQGWKIGPDNVLRPAGNETVHLIL